MEEPWLLDGDTWCMLLYRRRDGGVCTVYKGGMGVCYVQHTNTQTHKHMNTSASFPLRVRIPKPR